MRAAIQVWNPDDWEAFALSLLHSRHGALNVHKIPAAHHGDFGIDYYCTGDLVAYQCYAVEEPVDISTRADRQKRKITTDLGKIVANASEVSKLFLRLPIRHWVLLAPLHDSKDVNLHCASKTSEIRAKGYAHLDANFEVSVQDSSSFASSAVAANMAALATVALNVPSPTPDELDKWKTGSADLLANATHKLAKRADNSEVHEVVAVAIRSFLQGSAILDALRISAPDLHEKVMTAVAGRSRRLSLAGPQGGPTANAILGTEIDTLVAAIKAAAPNLSNDNAELIAFGTVAEWVMRCPLDFPPYGT